MKICLIENCGEKHYAKSYCRKHYANFCRCDNPLGKYKKCKSEKCNIKTTRGYCLYHLSKINRGLPPDDIRYTPKGKRNGRWAGGISEYKNHYEMKKNRLIKLKQTESKCEICKRRGRHIHHKDGSKNNHNLENLLLVCHRCHGLIHQGRKNKTSKFTRLYGMTLDVMAERFGGSSALYYRYYQKETLKEELELRIKEEREKK